MPNANEPVPVLFRDLTTGLKIQYCDWSDYTVKEIAEELCVTERAVISHILRLKDLGINVPHKKAARRDRESPECAECPFSRSNRKKKKEDI